MKRFLTTTALVLATAGGAAADSDTQQLRNQVTTYFETSSMNVDVATMTDEQISELFLAINGNEAAGERDAAVRAVLNDWNVVYDNAEGVEIDTPNSQLRTQVGNYFDQNGISVDVGTLTDAEVSEVYLAMTSGEESGRAAAVNDILANRDPMPGAGDMPGREQLLAAVGQALDGTVYDGRETTLTDAELAEAYLAITGSMSAGEKNKALRSVFN